MFVVIVVIYDDFIYRLNDSRFQYILASQKLNLLLHTPGYIRILFMRMLKLRLKDFSNTILGIFRKEEHVQNKNFKLSKICVSC